MGLLQDLYAANKENQTFLHTRFGLGEDVPSTLFAAKISTLSTSAPGLSMFVFTLFES